jgi:Tol biopolymer transport system component
MKRPVILQRACCALLLFALQCAATSMAAVTLDQAAADRYEGYYLFGPQRSVHFWREGDHFYFGAVGTPQRAAATPEGVNKFSYANGGVLFTFNAGADGKITGLTITQGGREVAAPRIAEELAKSFPAPGSPQTSKPAVARTWSVMPNVSPRDVTTQSVGVIDYWPCFSPDGKTVLFSRTLDGGKIWALFRVPAAGGKPEPFGPLPVSATRASWSAKSRRIVFNGDAPDGKDSGLWVVDGDGRNARHLMTKDLLAPSYPSWYPDGKTIGFGDAARNILYRMDIDGTTPAAVTHQDQVLAGMSSVAPDGKSVAFAGQANHGQLYNQDDNQIWLVDGSGNSSNLEPKPLQGRTPSWSPDGKRLAFESDRGSPNGLYAVFIVNRDGSGLVQVTDYALNAGHPVFSPDGRRLVFASGDPATKAVNIAVVTLQ